MQPYSFIKFAFTLLTKHYRAPIQTVLMMAGPLWPIAISAKKEKEQFSLEWKKQSIVAICEWLTIIGSTLQRNGCFDAPVADWQSAGFLPIYHSSFICCCQTFSTASIPETANQTTFLIRLKGISTNREHSRSLQVGEENLGVNIK